MSVPPAIEREWGQDPPTRTWILSGNASEIGDVSGSPGESSLFSLTEVAQALESHYAARGRGRWQSSATSALSGALPMALENPMA